MPDGLGMIFERLPAYWVWVFAVVGIFYGGTRFFGGHLSESVRDTLRLWLTQRDGEARTNWSRQFCAMFDAVFGARHLSVGCFLRSSVASLLGVLALYLLFGPVLGLLQGRTPKGLSMTEALVLGALVNVIPDYLSLLETRWLLRFMDRWRGFWAQVVLLAVDLVVSAAIIWLWIQGVRWVIGEPFLSVVELLAFFSIYSVFFYSSFFTSIWAWLYCGSMWFLRLFTGLGLNRVLDVWGEPVKQVALVGSVLMVLGGAVVAPVAGGGGDGEQVAGRFDIWLCSWFPDETCDHLLRQIGDEDARMAVLLEVCEGRAVEWCGARAEDIFDGDEARAAPILRRACEGGRARACFILGWMHEDGRGVAQSDTESVALYRQGCDGGHAGGCTNLGGMHLSGRGVAQSDTEAVALYRQGCDGRNARGCTNLGWMYEKGRGVAQSDAEAVALYRQGCDGGDAPGCTNLGWMHEDGRGVAQSDAEAVALYRKGCDGGNAVGCGYLGDMVEYGKGVAEDMAEAIALYQQGCDGDNGWSCDRLADRYREGRGVDQDSGEAARLRGRACELDVQYCE